MSIFDVHWREEGSLCWKRTLLSLVIFGGRRERDRRIILSLRLRPCEELSRRPVEGMRTKGAHKKWKGMDGLWLLQEVNEYGLWILQEVNEYGLWILRQSGEGAFNQHCCCFWNRFILLTLRDHCTLWNTETRDQVYVDVWGWVHFHLGKGWRVYVFVGVWGNERTEDTWCISPTESINRYLSQRAAPSHVALKGRPQAQVEEYKLQWRSLNHVCLTLHTASLWHIGLLGKGVWRLGALPCPGPAYLFDRFLYL